MTGEESWGLDRLRFELKADGLMVDEEERGSCRKEAHVLWEQDPVGALLSPQHSQAFWHENKAGTPEGLAAVCQRRA